MHAKKLANGDKVTAIIKGKTKLTKILPGASYKVYDQAGRNMAAGVLSNVISLNTPDFTIKLDLTLDDHTVIGDMIDWSFDIFNGQSGSLEGFCVQVANDAYTDALRKKKNPKFEIYCKDNGDGTWTPNQHLPDPVSPAKCVLEA